MTHRFFVPPDSIAGEIVSFTADQRKQMRNVLRLRPGDLVAALDGSGREHLVKIRELSSTEALGHIVDTRTPQTEPEMRLTVIQGMPKGEKPELILQKCTEIGASEFILMETARTVPKVAPDKLPGRLQRWNAIVREAAEQSGRTLLPSVTGIVSFQDALARAKNSEAGIIAWEGEHEVSLLSMLPGIRKAHSIAYMVGPEGGFTEDEVQMARDMGIVPVSLGPRILRTETAAIVGATLVVYGAGE